MRYAAFVLLMCVSTCNLAQERTKTSKSIDAKQITNNKKKKQKKPTIPTPPNKTVKNMTMPELRITKQYALANNYKDWALQALDRMLVLSNDQQEVADLRLERADLYFEVGKFEKAERLYKEFAELYASSPHMSAVKYKEILCSYYQTLAIDRDQSATKNTLNLANNYLRQGDVFSDYNDDVRDIQRKCCRKLLDHEIYVYTFYLNRGSYQAAQQRVTYMREHFLPILPEMNRELLVMETDIAKKTGNKERQKELLAQIKEVSSLPDKTEGTRQLYAKRF